MSPARRILYVCLFPVLGAGLDAQAPPRLYTQAGDAGRIRFDRDVLGELVRGERRRTRLHVAGDTHDMVVRRVDRGARHAIVRGRIPGGAVVLVTEEGIVAGHVDTGATVFTIRYSGAADLHVLRPAPAPAPECGVGRAGTAPPRRVSTPPAETGGTLVDVMVIYTPLARQRLGGEAATQAEIRLRIAMANDCNGDSGVGWRFRLVHAAETQYTEPNPVRLPQVLGQFRSTNDGVMDEVHALRDRYGADVMALVCDGENRDWSGYAYCRSSRGTAFSVTHRAGLASHLLHHEIGHNLGCAHNRTNVDCSGSYSYSYGWRTPDNVFHTVMAYKAGSSKRVNVWSSPEVLVLNYVMGTTQEDNARSLNNRGPTVASFSPTVLLEWCRLSGGIAGTHGVPALAGSGARNRVVPLRVEVSGVPASAPGLFVAGGRTIDLPLLGGTLVPALDLVQGVIGNGTLDATFLSLLPPGVDVWFQAFFVDAKAVQGWSATDAIRTKT